MVQAECYCACGKALKVYFLYLWIDLYLPVLFKPVTFFIDATFFFFDIFATFVRNPRFDETGDPAGNYFFCRGHAR